MKLQSSDTLVTDGIDANATRAFSFKANGKAFKVMIDGLYSEKIDSVVREVCSNAYDSHIEAGKAHVPFDVKMPTSLEPVLVVRDFGLGLSKDMAEHLFSTIFESTKEQSNDSIGAFGLGSKSPFAITDQFTVESRFDGMLHIFLVYKDASGVPVILPTHYEPDDEGNGVTVKIPVPPADVFKVQAALKRQLYLFPHKPTVNGSVWGGWVSPKEDSLLALRTRQIKGAPWTGHRVSMGPVSYPLNLSELSEENQSRLKLFDLHNTNDLIITEMPMGSLDLQPSREGLSYIAMTKDNLNEYFDQFFDTFIKTLKDDWATKQTNLYEAWKYASNVWQTNRFAQSFMEFECPALSKKPLRELLKTYNVPAATYNPIEFKTQLDSTRWGLTMAGATVALQNKVVKHNGDLWTEEELLKIEVRYKTEIEELFGKQEDALAEPWYENYDVKEGVELKYYAWNMFATNRNMKKVPRTTDPLHIINHGAVEHLISGMNRIVFVGPDEQKLEARIKEYILGDAQLCQYTYWFVRVNKSLPAAHWPTYDDFFKPLEEYAGKANADKIRAFSCSMSKFPMPTPVKRVAATKDKTKLHGTYGMTAGRVQSYRVSSVDNVKPGTPMVIVERGKPTGLNVNSKRVTLCASKKHEILSVNKSATGDIKALRAAGCITIEEWTERFVQTWGWRFMFIKLAARASKKCLDIDVEGSAAVERYKEDVRFMKWAKNKMEKRAAEAGVENIEELWLAMNTDVKFMEIARSSPKCKELVRKFNHLKRRTRMLSEDPVLSLLRHVDMGAIKADDKAKEIMEFIKRHMPA